MGTPHRLLAAALLAPMWLLAVSAWDFVGLRCRMTGMISPAICCPANDASHSPAQGSLDAPGCCERVVIENVKPPFDGASLWPDDPPAAMTVAGVVADSESTNFCGFRDRPNAEPPDPARPPLHLLKRSLLI